MRIQILVESVPLAAVFSHHCGYTELPGLRTPDDKSTSHC